MTSSSTSPTSRHTPPKFELDLSVMRAELMCQLLTGAPASVLDVGCSYGYALQRLAERLPEARLAGVDLEQDKLDLAQTFAPGKFELYCAPAHEMPFDQDEFEWVYCSHTLEHCHDIPAVVGELIRVAHMGLFIVVPLEGSDKYERLRKQELDAGNPGSHMHQFHTKDPFVWMDFFRNRGLIPMYYKFTDRSDMILALVKQANVRLVYGGFRKDNYEDRTDHTA